MTCPKCGHELAEGNMYCEVCGEEMQIVPDFEPEIENSMSDVLSDVADQIDPTRTEKEVEHIRFLTDTIDISNDVVILPKNLLIKCMVAVISLISIAVIIIAVFIYRDNSYDYQLRKGDESLAKGDYNEAVDYYQDAYRLDKTNTEALKRIASVYENYENLDKAEETYLRIVEYNGDLTALEALINLYVNDEKYSEVCSLLEQYGDERIVEKYKKYMSPLPEFSLQEGEYTEVKELVLSSSEEGNIYYTLDGSEPGSDSEEYEMSIVLRNGVYNVSAIFVNGYGISSEVVTKKYTIITNVPESPIVSLQEGVYEVPQLIRVIAPLNSNVYYTTDGTEPSKNSAIYTDPIAIPVGDSFYRFVAINDEDIASEIISVHYTLNVETNISQQEAIDLVRNRQYELGRVTTPEGNVAGSEGKYMYSYSELRYVQNRTMYFISEYYQEGTIRMVTGNLFAVDVYDGQIYQAVAGSNNNYSLIKY